MRSNCSTGAPRPQLDILTMPALLGMQLIESWPKQHLNCLKVISRVRVDGLTVEARLGDLVVPRLGAVLHPSLHSGLVLLLSGSAPVDILTHISPVQLGSQRVVTNCALICPPLSHGLQLSAPHLDVLNYILKSSDIALIGRDLLMP